MPSKSSKLSSYRATSPTIPKELVDQFVSGPMTREAVNEACLAFKKALIERALGAEMGLHLGYPPGGARPALVENHRNGSTGKTVLTDGGTLRVDVPRDRDGSFALLLIPKHHRRFTGFDDKIIGLYPCGVSVREIQAFLLEAYGTEVSADFISSVTDAVIFNALRVKVSRGCGGAQQGGLFGAGRAGGRQSGYFGSMDREHGGCEVLDEGVQ